MGRKAPPRPRLELRRSTRPQSARRRSLQARHTHAALRGQNGAAKVRRMAPWAVRLRHLVLLVALGCGGASDATKNRTFYDWSLGDGSQQFERPYPRLDWPENSDERIFLGVSVLQDRVQFSRPSNWRLRNASN